MSSMLSSFNDTFTKPGLTLKGALLGPAVVGLTSNKSPGAPKAVAPAPTVDNSQAQLDVAAQLQQQAIQRGLTSTLLTGGAGLSSMGTTSKTLLGG
jgi:hypothetical protein